MLAWDAEAMSAQWEAGRRKYFATTGSTWLRRGRCSACFWGHWSRSRGDLRVEADGRGVRDLVPWCRRCHFTRVRGASRRTSTPPGDERIGREARRLVPLTGLREVPPWI